MNWHLRQKYEMVKAIPDQVRLTLTLAISALFVAFIALAMSVVGNRAH